MGMDGLFPHNPPVLFPVPGDNNMKIKSQKDFFSGL
ncbi:MAG: hypothetical protein K0R89_1829, partial [Ramlibacter sp.]|nr:hypothetical protein [Ramlibacter sp.]